MKLWWISFWNMEFIKGKFVKVVLGVEKAGNRWFSGKSTGLGIRNRVRGFVLFLPYCSNWGAAGEAGRERLARGKNQSGVYRAEPHQWRVGKPTRAKLQKGCIFLSPKSPSSWSIRETDSEYRFWSSTSRCRFQRLCFLAVWPWTSEFTSPAPGVPDRQVRSLAQCLAHRMCTLMKGSDCLWRCPAGVAFRNLHVCFSGRVLEYYVRKMGLDGLIK